MKIKKGPTHHQRRNVKSQWPWSAASTWTAPASSQTRTPFTWRAWRSPCTPRAAWAAWRATWPRLWFAWAPPTPPCWARSPTTAPAGTSSSARSESDSTLASGCVWRTRKCPQVCALLFESSFCEVPNYTFELNVCPSVQEKIFRKIFFST